MPKNIGIPLTYKMELLVLLCIALFPNAAGQFRKTDSCPSGILRWNGRKNVFPCPKETTYHCILAYNSSQLYEACMVARIIRPGQVGCPWILLHNGRSILGIKNSECPVTNPDCPSRGHRGYMSSQLYHYPACFMHRSARNSKLTTPTTKIHSTTLRKKEKSSSSESTTNINVRAVVLILCSVIVIIICLMVFLRRQKIKEKCMSQQGSTGDTEYERDQFVQGNGTDVTSRIEERDQFVQGNGTDVTSRIEEKDQFVQGNGTDVTSRIEDVPRTTPHQQHQVYVKQSNEVIEVHQSGSRMEFETSNGKKDLSDDKAEEEKNEDLVKAVFSIILDFPDGIAEYDALFEFLQQEDMFSGLTKENLEDLLRCNSTLFRLLEDSDVIVFVIAYNSLAQICEKYNWPLQAGECTRDNCGKFHICLLNLKGICSKSDCKLFHTYTDAHNRQLKETVQLNVYSDNEMNIILLNQYPNICSIRGCKDDNNCPYLHICDNFCNGKCKDESKCPYGHSFNTEHNAWILMGYGIPKENPWSSCERVRCFFTCKR